MHHQRIHGYVAQRLGPISLIFVLLSLLLLALRGIRGIQKDVNPKMILQVLLMAAFLGVASFVVGMLPLLYLFSKRRLDHLSALGTGLLLGTALGVIIPEGIETVAGGAEIPTNRISTCLVVGFLLMLVVEQLFTPDSHSHTMENEENGSLPIFRAVEVSSSQAEFDTELGDLHDVEPSTRPIDVSLGSALRTSTSQGNGRAFGLLLGLVIHGIADGLALGISNVARNETGSPHTVSFVVFLALILHKAPTSLAFTTSMLSMGLPLPSCKKYVAIFSASTPLATIVSYLLFDYLIDDPNGNLVGTALLISGGSFLYVASVLQPVSHTSQEDIRPIIRVILISTGMLVPCMLNMVLNTFFNHKH